MIDLSQAIWRKSTRSGGNGGECVEVAANLPDLIAIRDSKDPGGPVLTTSPSDWLNFTAAIEAGHFDR